ncbi:GNAT family N-acetyltransferase [Inquilinus sp. Marseille-Q2685]|uniref:GNAT family N-acetyltransferase n=1 Tax=Inquilinus sp. Marseille-Q2685 TaxID=2866581 RepID=UPI001CE43C86|nr:GNAT family N-acetyltransferase [Inquilinus sp. Marseille-Q2685]
MTGFRPVAGLSRDERARVGALVAGHPVFALYWAAALDAAAVGDRCRSARLEPEGVVLGIDFDGLSIYTPVGAVGDVALLSLAADPRPLELHLTSKQADRLRPACGHRLALEDGLRFYARPLADIPEPDPGCRRMGPTDLEPLRRFYAAHYPATVFSSWMLDLPFVAIVEDGRPVAAAGAITRAGGRAMIGNFLVAPARRGEGLAGRVLAGLLAVLRAEGTETALLATNDANPAACRVYERAGFALIERRVQLDLRAA